MFGRGKPVILEIDPPVDRVSIDRRHFYQRLGFVENGFAHVHPPYRAGYQGHRLVVMSRPAISAETYGLFADYLNHTVMRYADGREGM